MSHVKESKLANERVETENKALALFNIDEGLLSMDLVLHTPGAILPVTDHILGMRWWEPHVRWGCALVQAVIPVRECFRALFHKCV